MRDVRRKKVIRVWTGAIARDCNLALVAEEEVEEGKEIEFIKEEAGVSEEVAKKALEAEGEYVLAGYVSPDGFLLTENDIPEDAEYIGINRLGDDLWEDKDGLWEPFYVSVEVIE
jgi:hypothetical protein